MIYRSYGCVLYEMVTLEKLFNGDSEGVIHAQILTKDIEIPNTDDKLKILIK